MYYVIKRYNQELYVYFYYTNIKQFNQSVAKECGILICVTNLMSKANQITHSLNYTADNNNNKNTTTKVQIVPENKDF